MVVKFLEQFLQISRALEKQGLYDTEDDFFYDRLVSPTGESTPIKVRTIAGLIPLLPAAAVPMSEADAVGRLGKRFARVRDNSARGGGSLVGRVRDTGDQRRVLISVLDPDHLGRALREFFDEDALSSPRTGCGRSPGSTTSAHTKWLACREPSSTTSRLSRARRCSGATPTGAVRCGCR